MSNNIVLRKAERKQAKLRIGVFGPSGAGKTWGSLLLARGITEWDKICVIDTENRSADLYSKLGDYNIINIDAPYTPEKYVDAIRAAVDAGMEVIIVDSITHEWAGKGGILEMVDEKSTNGKNSFTAWGDITPRHNNFIDAITACPVDIICCGRSKQEYVLNQKEKNGKMINVPEKVGLKAVTREGFDYEMTVSFEIDINHYATSSKDRTGLFMDKPEFKLGNDTGAIIKAWNAEVAPDIQQQKLEILRQLKRLGLPFTVTGEIKAAVLLNTELELVDANFGGIIAKLRVMKPDDAKQLPPPEPPATPPAAPTSGELNPESSSPASPAEQGTNLLPVSHETPAKPTRGKPVPGIGPVAQELKHDFDNSGDLATVEQIHTEYLANNKDFTGFENAMLTGAYNGAKTRLANIPAGGTN